MDNQQNDKISKQRPKDITAEIDEHVFKFSRAIWNEVLNAFCQDGQSQAAAQREQERTLWAIETKRMEP